MMIRRFWSRTPFSTKELFLLEALEKAHTNSADRGNVSSHAVLLAASGSRDYCKAIAAALMTLGGPHAPIQETMELLMHDQPGVRACALLEAGGRVPGWGSSFEKGHPDPLWSGVDATLADCFPAMSETLRVVTIALQNAGKRIFPNPSAYTAATAIIIGLPPVLSPYLFLASRLPAWSQIAAQHLTL